MSRYYTSPHQLARAQKRGWVVDWLECGECGGLGFYPDPDEPTEPELCERCRGRGGDWGVLLATIILSCNCGECVWCERAGAA